MRSVSSGKQDKGQASVVLHTPLATSLPGKLVRKLAHPAITLVKYLLVGRSVGMAHNEVYRHVFSPWGAGTLIHLLVG